MRKHWITLSLVAAVVVCAVVAAFFLSRPQGDAVMENIVIEAQSSAEHGIALDNTFAVRSKYNLSEQELRDIIEIEPAFAFELEGKGKRWTITPTEPLEKNTVYTFRVRNARSAVVRSYAFQTESDLAVGRVYPQNEESYVPLDTGIEITFNAPDIDLADYFEILPAINGTFETGGYSVIFKPEQPLEMDSTYRIRIKKGLKAPNGMQLKEDYSFSFETVRGQDKWDYTDLRLQGAFAETFVPGDPVVVEMAAGDRISHLAFDVALYKFPDIDHYISQMKAKDAFYRAQYGARRDYIVPTEGLEQVASFRGALIPKSDNEWGSYYAVLPDNLEEGHYVAVVSGENEQGRPQLVQKLIQISPLSVYSQSVDGDLLLWLNDAATGGPASGYGVTLIDGKDPQKSWQATTQEDGVARILTKESSEALLEVRRDAEIVYAQKLALSAQEKEAPMGERFISGIYTDREIYMPDDTIHFWGVVRPRRATETQPDFVYALLSSGSDDAAVYKQRIEVAENGTFSGSLDITGLHKTWYTLSITDGENGAYTANSFMVEKYTKPAFVISASTDKPWYYANETVNIEVSASYFDGTPAAGVRLEMRAPEFGLGWDSEGRVITLDESGKATTSVSFTYTEAQQPGWEPRNVWYQLTNADPEDVQVYWNGEVKVLPSRIAAKLETTPDSLTIYTAQLDTAKLDQPGEVQPLGSGRMVAPSQFDRLAGAPVDIPVIVNVYKTEFIATPAGQYYDYVNKRNITRYTYERKETLDRTVRTRTQGGKVLLSDVEYRNTEKVFYHAQVVFSGGVMGDVLAEDRPFYRWLEPGAQETKNYTFINNQTNGEQRVALNESFTLELYENGVKVPNKGRVLFGAVQRKMLDYGFFAGDKQTISMHEDFLPNVVMMGAYFDGRHVYRVEPLHISHDYSENRLQISIETDQESYAPGEQASVTVVVRDAAGNPVQGDVCIGVVDEAVFALVPQELDFADQLYRAVYYPNYLTEVSYVEYDLEHMENRLDDGAGGGGDEGVLRSEFVDTALFETVRTDQNGKAQVELALPDNVTAWRVTAVALTDDLKAGNVAAKAVATLPYYLRTLVTDSYLLGDEVTVAVSGVGTQITPESQANYTVTLKTAQGKELQKLQDSGNAGARTVFTLGKLDEGSYTIRFDASCGEYTDAVEQTFAVIRQGLTVPVIRSMPINEVNTLKSVRYPVTLTIYDERMKPFMDTLEFLSRQDGQRTEMFAAAWRARVIYNSLLEEADRQTVARDMRLDEIQHENGGVRMLPLAQPDAAVTAKLLMAAPELVNRSYAQAYLQSVLSNPAVTPDERAMAYAGLAAAKAPVMLDVRQMLENTDLTVRQRLYLGAGLAALGDFEHARAVYDALQTQIVTEGDLKYVEGDGTAAQRLENTAAALMLTSLASHPDADALLRFLLAQQDARSRLEEPLYNLEMLAYVAHYTAPRGKEAGKFSYQIDGKTEHVELGELGLKPLSMSAEALETAEFKLLSGKVYATVGYTDYAQTTQLSDQSKVRIEKSYIPVSTKLETAGRVRVELKITFADDAPYGSYNISDYIPSGMRSMGTAQGGNHIWVSDRLWGNVEFEGQQVRATIYRDKPDEENPWPGDAVNPNEYKLQYYISAALPGEYVTERAFVTAHEGNTAAASQRGTIQIAP